MSAGGEKAETLFIAERTRKDVHRDTHTDMDIASLLLEQVRLSGSFAWLLKAPSLGAAMAPREAAFSTTSFEKEQF
jgi:hypothetical protein